jgi:hypothetical protein
MSSSRSRRGSQRIYPEVLTVHRYIAFGPTIASTCPLPELAPESSGGRVDLTVEVDSGAEVSVQGDSTKHRFSEGQSSSGQSSSGQSSSGQSSSGRSAEHDLVEHDLVEHDFSEAQFSAEIAAGGQRTVRSKAHPREGRQPRGLPSSQASSWLRLSGSFLARG